VVSGKVFKILSFSTKNRSLSPEDGAYPPSFHNYVHRLGVAAHRCSGVGPPLDRLAGIDQLNVASLNLHCGADVRGEPYDVAAAIGLLDASVVCLQEDWVPAEPSRDRVAAAASALGLSVHRAELCRLSSRAGLGLSADGGPGRLCISVLTALPVTGSQAVRLGRGPGDPIPRAALVVALRSGAGGVLRIVNTHLTFAATSPVQLWRLWRWLRADPVPTVIAGDLNMPGLFARQYGGLTALVRGATFPAEQPVVQLDHVLASRGVEPGRGAVLPWSGSDHLPVRARLHGISGWHQA